MKVAVVGSGVSGLAATWLLNEYSEHEVHLYESDTRPGGHANTVRFQKPGAQFVPTVMCPSCSGFIVFNPSTYPNFLRFLNLHPAIHMVPTEMTFSVSRDNGAFEWAGTSLRTVFCQPSRLFDPSMWRLIYDVLRFNACARRLIIGMNQSQGYEDCSIGEYISREGYSDAFRDNYLIPMTAAVWSTPPDTCAMNFPARTLIQFLSNHHLLQITGKPSWLTIRGGSRLYVNEILDSLPKERLHLSTPVKALETRTTSNGERSVRLITSSDQSTTYDHVILACHSDTALFILKAGGGLTVDEEKILGRFRWNKNEAVLHSDTELMPRQRLAWSSWNYLTFSEIDAQGKRRANVDKVALTYGMNDLQHIPEEKYGPVLVTLNPPKPPRPDQVVGRYRYDHPVLDHQAVLSQREVHLIQGKRGISYAGAWLRYGFHEDGFTSGLRAVVDHIDDVDLPFEIQDADREPGSLWMAIFFDIFEKSGARPIVDKILTLTLGFYRIILGLFLDFSHIDAP